MSDTEKLLVELIGAVRDYMDPNKTQVDSRQRLDAALAAAERHVAASETNRG